MLLNAVRTTTELAKFDLELCWILVDACVVAEYSTRFLYPRLQDPLGVGLGPVRSLRLRS